ncbi:hypothetical protein JYU34_019410 [Plutella xylostella]|uniref:Uncharacterized protein n=2 Tax=Plutella xylostella TaxID=51655 RepID=A0ABQ7PXG3_PLUXY|nr:zinc finger protein 26 [Plutella xylostella]KAG7297423.1 hypothetical protein JYU34_019410 [Plutella xylostella]CAG9118808.1 unnamed protein product [Plutella xylostella]
MISSYLLLKFVQRSRALRVREVEERRLEAQENQYHALIKTKDSSKCRICLQEGNIPIYGAEDSPDISESVASFANINITQEDEYPKFICDTCHKLLEGAIMFRKTAQQSDQILKDLIKTEIPDDDYFDLSPTHENDVENIIDVNTKKFFMDKRKNKYHCKVCYIDFRFLDEYYDHINSAEHKKQKSSPNIQCRICNKTLRRYYFKQHLDLHKSEKLYKVKCKICKQLYRKGEYKEHLASHGPQQTTYICEVCGRSFHRRNVYKCHLQTHSTDFPHKCQYCPYRGRNSGLLKIHMRTHTGDYRYQCSDCSARFLTSSNLNRHMSKHKGRNFECDTCKRRFYSKHELEQHFKVDHLGIKEHICNMCGKAFGYRNAMKKHQLHVHKREKFIDGKGRMPSYLEVERKKQQGIL